MSPRYLLIAGAGPHATRERLRLCGSGLEMLYSNGRITVLGNRACRCTPIGEAGCILGLLFRRDGRSQRVATLNAQEAAAITGSGGHALLRDFWGGYIAATGGSGPVVVLRDPSGTSPCYYVESAGMITAASDAELLVDSGAVGVEIDFEEIGRQLYRAFVPAPATALRGIRELLAGFGIDNPANGGRQLPCWSPWDHVGPARDEVTAEDLARIVRRCIEAWASVPDRLLLSVSGGLDSSIVAACLARAPAETVCLTMFTDDPAGDERKFARGLCDHLGLQLIERRYRLEDIDITAPLAPHLPRPRDRTQALAYERVHREVAAEMGSGAFVTGNGGDHVFGYSQSAAPVADRYLADGLGRGTFQALLDVCRQTGCSMADAVRQASRLARGPPRHRIRPNALLLHPDFVAGLGEQDLEHPWLEPPPIALPGKAAHIATILRVQPNIETDRGAHLPVFSPLLSQPIVEACLRIPTWQWRAGGRDRSLARRAFAGDLPAIVLDRSVKGTPGRFAARLLDRFREPIGARLLDGWLASHRIVDSGAIETLLTGERPIPDLERVRLLELVNAEAWIDHWIGHRGRGKSPGRGIAVTGDGVLRP